LRDFTRRELLATFLGLPAATLAGCRHTTGVAQLPPGELVGPSSNIGHRLRDRLRITPSKDRWTRHRVVIVGGGVAGYSAARRLLQSGWDDFVLLELEHAPGGTSRSGRSEVVAYPWGAHYLPVPLKENHSLLELLAEMNVLEGYDAFDEPIVAKGFLCRQPTERLFFQGRWQEGHFPHSGSTTADRAQFQAFNRHIDEWVAWRDGRGRRAFTLPLLTGSDDPEVTQLDQISMSDWLSRHGLNSPRLRWFVNYCCRDDYGMTAEQTSAWAGLFYFASRIRRPGDESQPLITWPDGNGHIIAHLHKLANRKADVRLGLAVTEITPLVDGGVDVVAVKHDATSAHGFHADHVVFAAPQFLRPYLLRHDKSPPSHVDKFEYGSWMVANLHLKEHPRASSVPLCWDNILYDSPSLGYVVATHQLERGDGPTVLTYYFPLDGEQPEQERRRLMEVDRDGWAEIALSDLERAHSDLRGLVERLDVMRWGHAMIRPRPGFVWGKARHEAIQPFRGIHFAHTDLSGVALFEEAFYHGVRAAEEVLAVAEAPLSL